MGLLLVLDHLDAGRLASLAGGAVSAAVVTTEVPGRPFVGKQLGRARFGTWSSAPGWGWAPPST